MSIKTTAFPRSIGLGVSLIALSTLLFEAVLTRIFSVTLWYHFGFLVISLALLGIASSGVFCYLFPERLAGNQHVRNMSVCALAFSILTPMAVFIHLNLKFHGAFNNTLFYLNLSLQIFLLFLAFFFSGLCITIALFRYASTIGTVYSYNLIGASLGSLLFIPLINHLSGPALVFIVSVFASLAAWLISQNLWPSRSRIFILILSLTFISLALMNDHLGILRVKYSKSYSSKDLQRKERINIFEKWSPLSRVTVKRPRRGRMAVTNDAGAGTFLYRFDGDYSKADFVENDTRQIAHRLKTQADVLIIGSGGGIDVLSALASKQKKITAVEINPVIGELVTKHFSDYIGNIFHDPRVNFHIQEGRNFTAGSRDKFDIIQVTMIDSWIGAAAAAYLFNENTLYTTEAIHDYMTHLKPDGILSITRYYDWDEALRITNTFVQYLHKNNVSDINRRMIIILEPRKLRRRATVLLKNGPFTESEVIEALTIVRQAGGHIIHMPYIIKDYFKKSAYAQTFRALISPQDYNTRREEIIKSFPKNITPSTDDRPFFFFMRRFRDTFRFDPQEADSRRFAMPILYTTLVSVAILALLTILCPLYLKSRTPIEQTSYRYRSLLYCAMLGAGYMLVEISLIQRLSVFLGHPIWSFIVVLSTLLCTSGCGSLMSSRWKHPKELMTVLSVIILIILFYIIFIYGLFTKFMWLNKPIRFIVAVITTAVPGFFMGMCFPIGMQIIRRFHSSLVPWGWGVNGAFSVFASIFAMVIALYAGFKCVLIVGGVCYVIAWIIIYSLRHLSLEQGV